MKIKAWSNFSKKRNSTKRPTTSGAEISVFLKEDTSIEGPSFILNEPLSEYTYIQAFGHFYFVEDVINLSSSQCEIRCSQDVLATYKDDIVASEQYVERSSRYSNPMLVDPCISPTQNIAETLFQSTSLDGFSTTGCYIVRISGGDYDGISTYVIPSLATLKGMFDPSFYFDVDDYWAGICKVVTDPGRYILSLYWCPLDYNAVKLQGTLTENIKACWFNTTMIGYRLSNTAIYEIDKKVNKPEFYYDDFRKYHPSFTQYTMYIPGIGNLAIAPENMAGDLYLHYVIDLNTGDVSVTLRQANTQANYIIIGTYTGNVFANIQLSDNNPNAGAVLQSALSALGAYASGNIPMAATAGVSAVSNIISVTPSIIGSNQSAIAVKDIISVVISECVHASAEAPNYTSGKPLYRYMTLGSLDGYVQCANASIDLNGRARDRDEVNSFLNGGFYIE